MQTSQNVTITDGKLILSLPEAKTPVVWQMDLEKAQSSAFTVQEDKKKKTFTLILKKEDGETEDIAPFDTKEDAVQILMDTSQALQNAHGKIRSGDAANTNTEFTPAPQAMAMQPSAQAPKKNGGKAGAILSVLLILVLLIVWSIAASVPTKLSEVGTSTASAPQSQSGGGQGDSGVPVSADDFLSNR